MSHIVILDGNNIGIASQFANPELMDGMGRPTGAIYGFCRSLRPLLAKIIEETGTTDIRPIVAWDSNTSWRKELLATYKSSRGDQGGEPNVNLERYGEQVPRIRDILKILGVSQLHADGYEADDIAGFMTRLADPNQVTLITNDKDWLQLVSSRVHCWRPLTENYITPANFTEFTGCNDTDEFVRLKALCGDKGDDVPGAEGVGDVTGLAYLRGTLESKTKAGKPAKKWEKADAWMKDPDGFDRSKKLVDLRDIVIPPKKFRIVDGDFHEGAMLQTFMDLSFNSILTDIGRWINPFRQIKKAA